MNVFGFHTDKRSELTTPFPPENGFKFRVLGGDVLDPNDWVMKGGYPPGTKPNWFNSIPQRIIRFRCPFALSFLLFVLFVFMILPFLLGIDLKFIFALPLMFLIPGVFFSVKLGHWGMYIGWKVYGVDSDAYKDWLPATDVFAGSLAMCFTVRMSLAR